MKVVHPTFIHEQRIQELDAGPGRKVTELPSLNKEVDHAEHAGESERRAEGSGSPPVGLRSPTGGMARSSTTAADDCPRKQGFEDPGSVFHGNIGDYFTHFGKSGLLTSPDLPLTS